MHATEQATVGQPRWHTSADARLACSGARKSGGSSSNRLEPMQSWRSASCTAWRATKMRHCLASKAVQRRAVRPAFHQHRSPLGRWGGSDLREGVRSPRSSESRSEGSGILHPAISPQTSCDGGSPEGSCPSSQTSGVMARRCEHLTACSHPHSQRWGWSSALACIDPMKMATGECIGHHKASQRASAYTSLRSKAESQDARMRPSSLIPDTCVCQSDRTVVERTFR